MTLRTRLLIALFVVLLPFAFDLGFFAAGLLPPVINPDQMAAVDVIVVLTGGQGRLKEAIQFLSNGKGKYLFVSGTSPNAQLRTILKANKIDDSFKGKIYDDQILLDDESRSTHENAVEIRRVTERLNAHSLLLVTSNYHMRRAMHLLETEFRRPPGYAVTISGYPVESPNFSYRDWWKNFTGWRILISEYFKSWRTRWIF